MNINLIAHGLRIDAGTDAFVRKQVHSALRRFDNQVFSVDAYLKDINGPKGGIDKQVLVRVRLQNGRVITAEVARARLRAAVVICLRKARRAVRRSLKKSQQRHRWRAAGLQEVTGA